MALLLSVDLFDDQHLAPLKSVNVTINDHLAAHLSVDEFDDQLALPMLADKFNDHLTMLLSVTQRLLDDHFAALLLSADEFDDHLALSMLLTDLMTIWPCFCLLTNLMTIWPHLSL